MICLGNKPRSFCCFWDCTKYCVSGFDYRTYTELGKQRLLEAQKNLVCTSTQEKGAVTPQETESGLPVWVFGSLWHRYGLTVACFGVRVTDYKQSWEVWGAGISPFEGGRHYCHYPHHSLATGETTGREHSPTHQQKIGLKTYWKWPCPPEQDPVFPTASPSHQEACTSFLSSSIRGQTEWKPQSQNTNQTDHRDHNLV